MTETLDVRPATEAVAALLPGVGDAQLGGPTPCADTDVSALLDHLMGLSVAFTVAASQSDDAAQRLADESAPGQASAGHLHPDWRTVLPQRLDALAAAWAQPSAWEGEAEAGGVTMPAPEMGTVVVNELVVHGWDLARATGQPFEVDEATAAASLAFTSATAREAGGEATPGLFGPAVAVPADASTLDRSLGFSGRDPAWRP